MFNGTKLMALLATLIMVPTVAYVLGQTIEQRSEPENVEMQAPSRQEPTAPAAIPLESAPPPAAGDAATPDLADQLAFQQLQEETTALKRSAAILQRETQGLGVNAPEHLTGWIGAIQDAIEIVESSLGITEATGALEILADAEENWEEQYTFVLLIKRLPFILQSTRELIRSQELSLARTQRETANDANARGRVTILSDRIIALEAATAKAQQLSSVGRASEALEFLEGAIEDDSSGTLQRLLTVHPNQIPPFDIPYFSFLPS